MTHSLFNPAFRALKTVLTVAMLIGLVACGGGGSDIAKVDADTGSDSPNTSAGAGALQTKGF